MNSVLLDTGCIVALLDRSERHHERSVQALRGLDGALVTCEAVIAECVTCSSFRAPSTPFSRMSSRGPRSVSLTSKSSPSELAPRYAGGPWTRDPCPHGRRTRHAADSQAEMIRDLPCVKSNSTFDRRIAAAE